MVPIIEVDRMGTRRVIINGRERFSGTAEEVFCWLAGFGRTGSFKLDFVMPEPTGALAGIYRAAAMVRADEDRDTRY